MRFTVIDRDGNGAFYTDPPRVAVYSAPHHLGDTWSVFVRVLDDLHTIGLGLTQEAARALVARCIESAEMTGRIDATKLQGGVCDATSRDR